MAKGKWSHADRERLAKKQGFKSYGEKRKIMRYAKKSEDFLDVTNRDAEEVRADDPEVLRLAKLHYEAFVRNPDDYSRKGPKAQWFVEVEGLMSFEEWNDHYPKGVRTGRTLSAA